MIRLIIPILALCFTASHSFGQIGNRLGNRLGDRPILSRAFQPAFQTIPGVPSTQPLVSNGTRALGNAAILGLGLANSNALTGIAYGIGPAIRLGRVIVAGSPYPGNRKDTLLWIAAPSAIIAREFIRERRGGPIFENGYQIFGGQPNFQQPFSPNSGYTQPMIVIDGCCYPAY